MENSEHQGMDFNDAQFERYLALIVRMYERMKVENSWPWVKSQEALDEFTLE